MALGTADEANEVTSTYRNNGQVETVTDGENNKTTYQYDGHDRLAKASFPSATKLALKNLSWLERDTWPDDWRGGARRDGSRLACEPPAAAAAAAVTW
jgi:YD repeat-containing protein